MEFKPFDDFREARAMGQAASALPGSNTLKVAEYREYNMTDAGDDAQYPITSAEYFQATRLQSIMIDQRICAVRITPHVKARSYGGAGSMGNYNADIAAIREWMSEQRLTLTIDGTPILNEVPVGSMVDGFTFDPAQLPIPKNSLGVVIDHSRTITSDWGIGFTPPLCESVVFVSIGYLVEVWYTK